MGIGSRERCAPLNDLPNLVEAFWNWSFETYEIEGVAGELIQCQDRYRTNVNLILYSLWRVCFDDQIDQQRFSKIQSSLASFNSEVTSPLRDARRAVGAHQDATPDERAGLKASILSIELVAERVEQRLILAADQSAILDPIAMRAGSPTDSAGARITTARGNVTAYFASIGQSSKDDRGPSIDRLIIKIAEAERFSRYFTAC